MDLDEKLKHKIGIRPIIEEQRKKKNKLKKKTYIPYRRNRARTRYTSMSEEYAGLPGDYNPGERQVGLAHELAHETVRNIDNQTTVEDEIAEKKKSMFLYMCIAGICTIMSVAASLGGGIKVIYSNVNSFATALGIMMLLSGIFAIGFWVGAICSFAEILSIKRDEDLGNPTLFRVRDNRTASRGV